MPRARARKRGDPVAAKWAFYLKVFGFEFVRFDLPGCPFFPGDIGRRRRLLLCGMCKRKGF
jgi:hypothetical protein